jgi:hypothetical protein
VFGGRPGSPRRRGVVLQLAACEDRVVPDGALPAPPEGWDTGAQSPPSDQSYSVTVQAGEWVQVGQVGGQEQWFTFDSHARQWLFSADDGSGAFTAVLLNYDGTYDPTEHPQTTANFDPAADKWNLVWNPDDGTWATVPPGTVFPAAVTGFTVGDWNYVHLPRQQPARPANPPQQAGSTTVTIAPGTTVTITTPPGITVTITPIQGGVTIQVNPGGQPSPPVSPSTWLPWGIPILWAGSGDSPYFGATDFPLGVREPNP